MEEYYLHLELGLALGNICIYKNIESQMSRYLLKMKCYVFSLHSITTFYIGHNSNRGAAFLPQ